MIKRLVLIGLFSMGSLCAQHHQVPAEVLATLLENDPGQLIALYRGDHEGVFKDALEYWYRTTHGLRSKQKLTLIKESLDYMATHRKQREGWSTASLVGATAIGGVLGAAALFLIVASSMGPIYR